MKVKELIKQLQKCDPDLYVGCYMDDGNILDIEGVDSSMVDRVDLNVTLYNEKQEDDQVYWC